MRPLRDWELYEDRIFAKLRREFRGCTFTKDAHVTGYFSNVPRQIDILIEGKLAGRSISGVVECKLFSSKVDVKDVEAFLGFLDDVRGHVGIMITNRGYSAAARNRAEVRDVKLDVITLDELEGYHLDWVECRVCRVCVTGENDDPRLIWFSAPYGANVDGAWVVVEPGRCDWCQAVHIRCWVCGEITGLDDVDLGEPTPCAGECGLVVQAQRSSLGSRWEESLRILSVGT
jgi:hypothetical protein